MAISLEAYELLEKELGKEKAEKVVKIIDIELKELEQKIRDQKPIIKAELKDELTKELVTKYELEVLRAELSSRIDSLEKTIDIRFDGLRKEIDALRNETDLKIDGLRKEIRLYIIILALIVIFVNQNSLEIILKFIGGLMGK